MEGLKAGIETACPPSDPLCLGCVVNTNCHLRLSSAAEGVTSHGHREQTGLLCTKRGVSLGRLTPSVPPLADSCQIFAVIYCLQSETAQNTATAF